MKTIIFWIALFSSTTIFSMPLNKPADLTYEQCTLSKVITLLAIESVHKEGEIANISLQTLNKIKNLVSKAKIKNKPIVEQLSIEDLDKFSRESERLQTMRLTTLIESRYQRDLEVIEQLVHVADSIYRWDRLPKESDPEYLYYAILIILDEESPIKKLLHQKKKNAALTMR